MPQFVIIPSDYKTLSTDLPDSSADRMDLQNLLKVATKQELSEAKRALKLITDRGFQRGKDLLKTLNTYLKEGK